jgi:hypothetical protein
MAQIPYQINGQEIPRNWLTGESLLDSNQESAPSVPPKNPNPGPGNGQSPSTSNSSGGVVNPKAVNAGTTLKTKLLRPALTSHFVCQFNPPSGVVSPDSELVSLSCSEASLPGTTLNTAEAVDKFHGMTEKFAYRRMYDDTAEFTFYVDAKNYDILRLFESWISFPHVKYGTPSENHSSGNPRIPFHRFKYKTDYERDVYITKFERDFEFVGDGVKVGAIGAKENRNKRTYTLHNAFPIAVNSMPLSYDSSQLLKCSVSFSYTHYSVGNEVVPTTQTQPKPNNPPSVPETKFERDIATSYLMPTVEGLAGLGLPEYNIPINTNRLLTDFDRLS